MKLPHSAALLLALAAAACAAVPGPTVPRTDALFARVHAGATSGEVEGLLGPPDKRMRFGMSGNEGWDYRYEDSWGYMAIYSVTFSPDGHVVGTLSNRINSGGDHK
ncbi:MAG TPA: hypothetical protein VHP55_00705 [Usitatibacter sp.]|jgi:hypothetical protein|nr:hypothetical protein [Usitatibacter sp.]